jgi:hypothetical protein
MAVVLPRIIRELDFALAPEQGPVVGLLKGIITQVKGDLHLTFRPRAVKA